MMSEPDSDQRVQIAEILRMVKELAGERCAAFVFIAEVEDDEGTTTIATWDGGFNTAVGLAERMKERLRQRIIETDFPDDPPGGEEWKEANT